MKRIIRFTLLYVYVCTQTNTLPPDSVMTVDAYDRRFYTLAYFIREGIKRKNKKVYLEKIMCGEYALDWSQSKLFLVH